jgi:hypothetical protein
MPARMFGPQKQTQPAEVAFTEMVLLRWGRLAPRSARRFVRQACTRGAVAARVADNAVLVAGELVAISVKQTRSSVELKVEIRDGSVTVSVHDESDLFPFPLRAQGPAGHYRSTDIVHRLSCSWGFVRDKTRRVVWAMVIDDEPAVSRDLPGGLLMRQARSGNAISGSPTSLSRWGSGSPARPT